MMLETMNTVKDDRGPKYNDFPILTYIGNRPFLAGNLAKEGEKKCYALVGSTILLLPSMKQA
jgi:hypothetical protein